MKATIMSVEVQRELIADGLPDDASLARWAQAAMEQPDAASICIRIVDEAEGRALNLQWRGKDYATNVLSFPGSIPPGVPDGQLPTLTGDIVLCAPVVVREAAGQDKSVADHWAHLVVHGVLHLRGFDHTKAEQAVVMEQLEREILTGLGIDDPYCDRSQSAAE